ncbi:DJC14 protein, partial [Molothrus ater]|nr:DJC14 protein [Molothrus ater]
LGERFRRRASRGGGSGDSDEEVTRLVTMAEVAEEELDPFRVLGVEPTATDTELRRAYRRLAVLVHPDKSRDPRAEAAFKVLRAGWERVSSPERRREYQAKQLAQGELARALGAFLGRLQEELRDAMDAMGCTRCGGRHRRFQLDRDPRGGRWCGPCGGWHAAEEGDLWAESSLLGLKVTYLARMDGHIYDVTEWAGCQRVAISPDSHRVPYHLSFGARTATPAGRQRSVLGGCPGVSPRVSWSV